MMRDRKAQLFQVISGCVLCILVSACNLSTGGANIPVYTVPPQNEKLNPVLPQTSPPPAFFSSKLADQINTRSIIVDGRNQVFGIGLWAGYIEEREVTAQEPIDIWFEYVPDEMQLEINGVIIKRSVFNREYKLGYSAAVTNLKYKATNTTVNDMSYNLHLTPSKIGGYVSVIVKEKWTSAK
jgi:hypothetical protein